MAGRSPPRSVSASGASSPGGSKAAAASRGWRRCSSATIPPPTSTWAASGRPVERPASARSTTSCPPTCPRPICSRSSPASTPTPRSTGSSSRCRSPGRSTRTRVLAEISAGKDVDGLTPVNAGHLAQGRIGVREALDLEADDPLVGLVPCTPAGVIEILDRSGVELAGAEAVVVGRSILVGRPMASLLVNADATVTVCHSRTRDLAARLPPRRRPGRRRRPAGDGRGRLDQAGGDRHRRRDEPDRGRPGRRRRLRRAPRRWPGAITPVPGGVGPMTIAMLLANTVRASR